MNLYYTCVILDFVHELEITSYFMVCLSGLSNIFFSFLFFFFQNKISPFFFHSWNLPEVLLKKYLKIHLIFPPIALKIVLFFLKSQLFLCFIGVQLVTFHFLIGILRKMGCCSVKMTIGPSMEKLARTAIKLVLIFVYFPFFSFSAFLLTTVTPFFPKNKVSL